MAKKTKQDQRGGTLGDFAAGVGTFLGKAEKTWRDWGPSDAIEQAVIDVRDRAAALLSEMNAARTTSTGEAAAPKRKTAKKAAKKTAEKASKPAPKGKAAKKARR